MTLRKKLLLLTAASFSLAILAGGLHQWNSYRRLLEEEESRFCKDSLGEFREFVEFHKKVAGSLSSYIARDPETARLVAIEARDTLYRRLRPLYEEVSRNDLVREMVIFKLPAITFLNVRNPRAPRRDVSERRKDVVYAGKTCTSTSSLIICMNYVGIRATSPILWKGEVVGVASVGIDMEDFLTRYTRITGHGSGLAVSDGALRRSLLERSYKRYLRDRVKKEGYVLETRGGLKPGEVPVELLGKPLSRLELREGRFVLCSEPLKDFSGNTIGYFFTYRDFSALALRAALISVKDALIFYLPPLFLLFALLTAVLYRVQSRIERTLKVIELIKQKRFDVLSDEKEKVVRDEIDMIRKAVMEMAEEIRSYVETLSKEIELYTNKAYTDSLTGLFNRRAFEEFGRRFLERTLSIGKPVSVLMIDVDNFKEVNDRFGHRTGDRVLSGIARAVKDALREADLVFRYGGEEFITILPGTNLEGALKAAENVRKKVELSAFEVDGREIRLTVSVGVAEGRKGERVDELIERADRSLYEAKRRGKNRVAWEA